MNARAEIPAEGNKPAPPPQTLTVAAPARPKRRLGRLALIVSLPILLAVGGAYFWFAGGRYVDTDNAYVQQTKISVSADVAGRISAVMVAENQPVKAGDLLFRLDEAPFRIAANEAEAALANARLGVEQLRAAYRTAEAKLKAAQSTAEVKQRELSRSSDLAGKGYAAQSALDEAKLEAQQADDEVALARQSVDAAAAALAGDPDLPTDRHPSVMAALAQREKAALDLEHTSVAAPEDGVVSQLGKLSVGQYVGAGTAMLSIVETHRTWIEANFKETQLTTMRVGQPAEITIDAYPDLRIEAKVDSIGAATGAEFSLIPAQNATGNWVKVVQRVPVRLQVAQADAGLLRTGMSANVAVDTGRSRFDRDFR